MGLTLLSSFAPWVVGLVAVVSEGVWAMGWWTASLCRWMCWVTISQSVSPVGVM